MGEHYVNEGRQKQQRQVAGRNENCDGERDDAGDEL